MFDIVLTFLFNVDDPSFLEKLEDILLRDLRGKQSDGPVSRYLNRPLSIRLSRYLV